MVSLSLGPLECEPHRSPPQQPGYFPGLQTKAKQAPCGVPMQGCMPRLQGIRGEDATFQVALEHFVRGQRVT